MSFTNHVMLPIANYFFMCERANDHIVLSILLLLLTCTLSWSSALLWMMMLLLLRSITDNRGVLFSSHLHQLLVTSIHRCATAARYVDNAVT